MTERTVLKRHAELVDRMAVRLGIDLQEAALRGQLDIDQISDAVLNCTGCAEPFHCSAWLDDPSAGTTSRTPGYCRNRDLFARLVAAGAG